MRKLAVVAVAWLIVFVLAGIADGEKLMFAFSNDPVLAGTELARFVTLNFTTANDTVAFQLRTLQIFFLQYATSENFSTIELPNVFFPTPLGGVIFYLPYQKVGVVFTTFEYLTYGPALLVITEQIFQSYQAQLLLYNIVGALLVFSQDGSQLCLFGYTPTGAAAGSCTTR